MGLNIKINIADSRRGGVRAPRKPPCIRAWREYRPYGSIFGKTIAYSTPGNNADCRGGSEWPHSPWLCRNPPVYMTSYQTCFPPASGPHCPLNTGRSRPARSSRVHRNTSNIQKNFQVASILWSARMQNNDLISSIRPKPSYAAQNCENKINRPLSLNGNYQACKERRTPWGNNWKLYT